MQPRLTGATTRLGSSAKKIKIITGEMPRKSKNQNFFKNIFVTPDDYEDNDDEQMEPPPAQKPRPLLRLLAEDSLLLSNVKEKSQEAKNECIRQINSMTPIEPSEFVRVTAKQQNSKIESFFAKDKERSDHRFNWCPGATNMLLQLWAENLGDIRGTRKNSVIYREFANEMSKYGPSNVEIKAKIDNMSRKYRLEAEKVRTTGKPSTWDYFHRIQPLLIGTRNVDIFEEIMFNKTESVSSESEDEISEFAEDTEANIKKEEFIDETEESFSRERPDDSINIFKDVLEFVVEQDEEEDKPREKSFDNKHYKPTKVKNSRAANRLLEIEEEKLDIEREKLKIMKEAAKDFKLFHKDLMQLLKRKTK